MNHDLRKITYDIISEFEKNKSQLKLTRDQIINKAEFPLMINLELLFLQMKLLNGEKNRLLYFY